MSSFIDSEALKNSLTDDHIIHLLKLLGSSEYTDRGGYLQFKTICHNEREEDAGFNLSYFKESKKFYCFSDCGLMDIYGLVRKRWDLLDVGDETHFTNIIYWVLNHTQVELEDKTLVFKSTYKKSDFETATQEIPLPEKNEVVLDSFQKYYPVEWLEDNISEKAMDKYNILFSPVRNAIVIPHYDANDRLIGIRRRALNEEDIEKGKYKPLYIERVSYSHPLGYNLYGLNRIKDKVRRHGKIVIAEGEKGVLQSETIYGDNNYVAAVCGNRINRWQIHLIMKYAQPKEVILAFDQDIEYDHLRKLAEKYSGYVKMSFVYDYQRWLNPKESPFDRPDVLEELLHRRIKIKQ